MEKRIVAKNVCVTVHPVETLQCNVSTPKPSKNKTLNNG